MKLRQAVFAAREMEPVRAQLDTLLGVKDAYVDPGVAFFGLTNVVMSIGDSFLEVVVPVEDGTTAGRLLERRGSPCGYMLIFQVDDFATTSARFDALGLRRVWSWDDEKASACHIHPKDVGGAIVSFDQMRPAEEWVWGGPDWRAHRATHATQVKGATLASPDPARLAARWSEVLGRPSVDRDGAHHIALDEGTFVEVVAGGEVDAIAGYTFAVPDVAVMRERAADAGLDADAPKIGDVALSFVQAD